MSVLISACSTDLGGADFNLGQRFNVETDILVLGFFNSLASFTLCVLTALSKEKAEINKAN